MFDPMSKGVGLYVGSLVQPKRRQKLNPILQSSIRMIILRSSKWDHSEIRIATDIVVLDH